MTETSRIAIDLLRTNEEVAWVADHLLASYSEGIAQSAKELAVSDASDLVLAQNATTARREKAKREKYETSRPYSEAEKIELLEFALEQVFITLPATQASIATALIDLGATANAIEFSAPDDEEPETGFYTLRLSTDEQKLDDLRARLERFCSELRR
jgi:hypothetical protein